MMNETLRQRMTCDKCHEVHTNDNLSIYIKPGVYGKPDRICFFCNHSTDIGTRNGTMGHIPGKPTPTVTREQDRLEAEQELTEAKG